MWNLKTLYRDLVTGWWAVGVKKKNIFTSIFFVTKVPQSSGRGDHELRKADKKRASPDANKNVNNNIKIFHGPIQELRVFPRNYYENLANIYKKN